MSCRIRLIFSLITYWFIAWPLNSDAIQLGCPKLNNLPHGGFICADATKRENKTNSSYDVRVCAPNCRTGYVASINNSIVFCTSNSKIWRLLPEDYSINDLECTPTVNILYHNNEDRLQVRIQDFIEGKLPTDLDSSYPKLLEKSDVKDVVEIFNTDRHSDINTIKRKETIDDRLFPSNHSSTLNATSSAHKEDDNLDYYSLKRDTPSDDSSSPEEDTPNKIVSHIESHPKHQDDIIENNNTEGKLLSTESANSNVNKTANREQSMFQDEDIIDKQLTSGLFQSPLSALKFLINTVALSKNSTTSLNDKINETTPQYNDSESSLILTTTATTQAPDLVLSTQPTTTENSNQYTIPPQIEWNNLESMFVENPYARQNEEVVDERSFPEFGREENPHTRNKVQNIFLPELPTQLNISPINIDMTSLEQKETAIPSLTNTPSSDTSSSDTSSSNTSSSDTSSSNTSSILSPNYEKVHKGKVESKLKNKTSKQSDVVVHGEKLNTKRKTSKKTKKSMRSSKVIKQKNPINKKIHYVNLIGKLKDGSILGMNLKQRTKLIEYIKNNSKLTRKSYCSIFYPICKTANIKNNKRHVKYVQKKEKEARFWTYPVT